MERFTRTYLEVGTDKDHSKSLQRLLKKEQYTPEDRYTESSGNEVKFRVKGYKVELDIPFLEGAAKEAGIPIKIKQLPNPTVTEYDDDDDEAYINAFPEEHNERGIKLSYYQEDTRALAYFKWVESLIEDGIKVIEIITNNEYFNEVGTLLKNTSIEGDIWDADFSKHSKFYDEEYSWFMRCSERYVELNKAILSSKVESAGYPIRFVDFEVPVE